MFYAKSTIKDIKLLQQMREIHQFMLIFDSKQVHPHSTSLVLLGESNQIHYFSYHVCVHNNNSNNI